MSTIYVYIIYVRARIRVSLLFVLTKLLAESWYSHLDLLLFLHSAPLFLLMIGTILRMSRPSVCMNIVSFYPTSKVAGCSNICHHKWLHLMYRMEFDCQGVLWLVASMMLATAIWICVLGESTWHIRKSGSQNGMVCTRSETCIVASDEHSS